MPSRRLASLLEMASLHFDQFWAAKDAVVTLLSFLHSLVLHKTVTMFTQKQTNMHYVYKTVQTDMQVCAVRKSVLTIISCLSYFVSTSHV